MKVLPYTLKSPPLSERGRAFFMPVRGKKMRLRWTVGSRYFFGFGKMKEEMSGMRVIRAIT